MNASSTSLVGGDSPVDLGRGAGVDIIFEGVYVLPLLMSTVSNARVSSSSEE